MSASAITGPSWTPWETKHAKGAALGEMSLPDPARTPEDSRKAAEAAATPQLSLKERGGELNASLSAQLFAALLDQQDFALANPYGDANAETSPANGATSVNGGSANLTDVDPASGGATGWTVPTGWSLTLTPTRRWDGRRWSRRRGICAMCWRRWGCHRRRW